MAILQQKSDRLNIHSGWYGMCTEECDTYDLTSIIHEWRQLGGDILGDAPGDKLGYSVAINSDGDFAVVGAPYWGEIVSGEEPWEYVHYDHGLVRVYKLNGDSWTKVGDDIVGESSDDNSGISVAIDSTGSRVAVGATGNDGDGTDTGHVRVYKQTASGWSQLGADINGPEDYAWSGTSVSLNDAGDIVAIGCVGSDSSRGSVAVYTYNQPLDAWQQLGEYLTGEFEGDYFGTSVSLNSAGDTLVIGSDMTNQSGSVVVYSWVDGAWSQIGDSIDGVDGSQLGSSVALNDTGNRIVIGSPGMGEEQTGSTRVYELNDQTWIQLGDPIVGTFTHGHSGNSVDIDGSGNRIVVGSRLSDTNGLSDSGSIRVYDWSGELWVQIGDLIEGEVTYGELGYHVAINSDGTRIISGIPGNTSCQTCVGSVRIYQLKTYSPRDIIFRVYQVRTDGQSYRRFDGTLSPMWDAFQHFTEMGCGKSYIVILKPGTEFLDISGFTYTTTGSSDSGRLIEECCDNTELTPTPTPSPTLTPTPSELVSLPLCSQLPILSTPNGNDGLSTTLLDTEGETSGIWSTKRLPSVNSDYVIFHIDAIAPTQLTNFYISGVTIYTTYNGNSATPTWANLKIEGSNNNSTWFGLYENQVSGEMSTHDLDVTDWSTNNLYRYYRLRMNGFGGSETSFSADYLNYEVDCIPTTTTPTPTPTPTSVDPYTFIYGLRENAVNGIAGGAKWLVKDQCSIEEYPYIKDESVYTIYPHKQLEPGDVTGHIDWFGILDRNSEGANATTTLGFLHPDDSGCVCDIVSSEVIEITAEITSGLNQWDEWYITLSDTTELPHDGNGYEVYVDGVKYTLHYWIDWILRTPEQPSKAITSGPTEGTLSYTLGTEVTISGDLPPVGDEVIFANPGQGVTHEVISTGSDSFVVGDLIYGLAGTKVAYESCGEVTSFTFNVSDNFQDFDMWKYWDSPDAPYLTSSPDEGHVNDPRWYLHYVYIKYPKFDYLFDWSPSPSLSITNSNNEEPRIQCLNVVTNVSMQNTFLFDEVPYDDYDFIGIGPGLYTLTGITEDHPIGFTSGDTDAFEVLTMNGSSIEIYASKEVNGSSVDFYTGTIVFEVNEDFGTQSYMCYNHGYMGGQNRLVYNEGCGVGWSTE